MASLNRRTDKQRPASSVFKPKFPIDPFAAAHVREPWFIRPDALPLPNVFTRRDVLLILGAPSAAELDILLNSKHLSNSLLIIATHQPTIIPHTALPTVRILKLKSPLAIEQAGAVRFVNVLEWAERVARLWRKYGGYGAAELAEDSDGQEHLPPPSLLRNWTSRSTPVSPASSAGDLSSERASSLLTPDYQPKSRPSSVTSRILSRARQLSMPPIDPTQRPFDGLINFLAKDIPDKALLKQAILVTTISRPFLISSTPRRDDRSKRKSYFSTRSATSVYMLSTAPLQSGDSLASLMTPPTRAHLIHVLPVETRSSNSFARSKLVQSLESFLLSFGFPATLDMKSAPDDTDRPRPYIMTSTSLGETISPSTSAASSSSPYDSWPSDYSLAELVLCGSLDGEDASSQSHAAPTRSLTRTIPRALLTRASDVVLLAEDVPIPPVVLVSQSEPGYQSSGNFPSAPVNHPIPVLRRASLASTASSGSPSTTSARSGSPRSPLARGDTYSPFAGLPTPPDSDESGPEYSPSDVSIGKVTKDTSPHPPIVTVLVHEDGEKTKRTRWKFWRRNRVISR